MSLRDFVKNRSNPQKRGFINLDCFTLFAMTYIFVITRAKPEAKARRWRVIQMWIDAFLNNNGLHAVCLWQAHCVNIQREARKGLKPPCYKKVDCFVSLAMTKKVKVEMTMIEEIKEDKIND